MKNYSLMQDFKKNNEDYIALIPVKKLFVTEAYKVGKCIIYPAKYINKNEIFKNTFHECFLNYENDFFSGSIIACPVDFHSNYPLNSNTKDDIDLLKKMIVRGENILDTIRYIFCNINYASNIPTRSGYINNGISGILLLNKKTNIVKFITDKYINNSESIGEGLNIDISKQKEYLDKFFILENDKCGEVGNIIKYALKQYSNIVLAENKTTKFMLSMSLIEYLANPYEYMNMKKVKPKIIPFIAETKEELEEISNKFIDLTSKKDEKDNQIGLRTCIVHNGASIESLIKEEYEVYNILRELQRYICNVIEHLYDIYDKNWSEVNNLIEKLRSDAQKRERRYKVKDMADSIVIIDIKFFNKALEEVYRLYPDYKNKKFIIDEFFMWILKQSGINRNGYKLPIQLFYDESCKSIFNSNVIDIGKLEQLGYNTPYGEIDIYTSKLKYYYEEIEDILIKYLEEMNDCIKITARFRNIVLISDRNSIDKNIFEKSKHTVKNIILGRLDNYRTTAYNKLKFFDIQILIMTYLGIDITQECEDDLIFFPKE